MHNIRHNPRPLTESFIIQVRSGEEEAASPKLNLSAMKIFNRFRKIIMKLLFSMPSSSSAPTQHGMSSGTPRKRNSTSCDRFEPPKTSCSSYYSSHSHYNEAISDCIEFFNRSSQDDPEAGGMISDDPDQSGCHMVWYTYLCALLAIWIVMFCFTYNTSVVFPQILFRFNLQVHATIYINALCVWSLY